VQGFRVVFVEIVRIGPGEVFARGILAELGQLVPVDRAHASGQPFEELPEGPGDVSQFDFLGVVHCVRKRGEQQIPVTGGLLGVDEDAAQLMVGQRPLCLELAALRDGVRENLEHVVGNDSAVLGPQLHGAQETVGRASHDKTSWNGPGSRMARPFPGVQEATNALAALLSAALQAVRVKSAAPGLAGISVEDGRSPGQEKTRSAWAEAGQ